MECNYFKSCEVIYKWWDDRKIKTFGRYDEETKKFRQLPEGKNENLSYIELDEDNRYYSHLKYVTLTDFINHIESLEQRINKLENK